MVCMTDYCEQRSVLPDPPPIWSDAAFNSPMKPQPRSPRGRAILWTIIIAVVSIEVFVKGWIVLAGHLADGLTFLLFWCLWQAWKLLSSRTP